VHRVIDDNSNHYKSMVMDVIWINQGDVGECSIVDKEPNGDVTKFSDLLKDPNKPLWDGCTNHSKLSIVAQVFTIKSIIGWARSVITELLNGR
jgi:hypothetical protein